MGITRLADWSVRPVGPHVDAHATNHRKKIDDDRERRAHRRDAELGQVAPTDVRRPREGRLHRGTGSTDHGTCHPGCYWEPEPMTNARKRRGDDAERELAHLLTELTGWSVERKLGAGRREDTGDLYGLPETTAQVKNYPRDLVRSIREGLIGLKRQHAHARTSFGMLFVRRPRTNGMGPTDQWIVVMTVEQAMTLLREATREGAREEGLGMVWHER